MAKALNLFRRPATVGILVFLILLCVTQLFTYQRYELVRHQRTRELTAAAMLVKERIEGALANSMAAATTLNIMVRNHGVNDFDTIARDILGLHREVDGLSLVQGETVTHIYPLKGNEAYLGYNIFEDTVSNTEVRRALRLKTVYFAGPYSLIQGGKGVISRIPIFIDSNYYGFATALIQLRTLFRIARLDGTQPSLYAYQLSKVDPFTLRESFYLPQSGTFDTTDAVRVHVPEGNFYIHARFTKPQPGSAMYPPFAMRVLFALVGGILGWYIAKRPLELQRQVADQMAKLRESEDDYASLFQQATDAILVIDRQGAILDANDSLCHLLQRSRINLLRMRVEDLVDPAELQERPLEYEEIMDGAQLFGDRRMIKRNGSVAEMEVSVKKIADNKILITGRDVTAQREAQKQLALRESTLRSAFNYSPIGMCLVSSEGTIIRTNRKLRAMLGHHEAALAHLNYTSLIHPLDRDADLSLMARAQHGYGSADGQELRLICRDGSAIWIHLNVSAVSGDGAEPLFYVCQIENITPEKTLARQLAERVKELQCLYGLSEISNRPGGTIESVMEAFVEKMPLAFQYPELARIRITFDDYVLASPDFRETSWKQEFPINTPDRVAGKLEVHYLSNSDSDYEGLFLKEERSLVNTLADMLGNFADRQKVQRDLAQSEEKFRSLVEQSLASVFIYQDDSFVYVNPAFEKTSGFNNGELIGNMRLEDLVHPDDCAMVRDNYASRMSGQNINSHYILKIVRRDRSVRHIEMVVSPLRYHGRIAVIGTIIDVSERMEEEKRIERAVTEAQEMERLHLGMELHDNIKQILAASRFRLSTLATCLHQPEDAKAIIRDLQKSIADAIRELRRLSHQLAPSIDPGSPLSEKIRSLAETMNNSGMLEISIDVPECAERLENDVQLALYRIVQEQLVNIIKYAAASHVEINVSTDEIGICMKIRDDGQGYDMASRKMGIGQENIRRRARILDGRVEIDSAPGAGCQLTVEIPLSVAVAGQGEGV